MRTLTLLFIVVLLGSSGVRAEEWTIDNAEQWKENIQSAIGATIADGTVSPDARTATVTTRLHEFEGKKSAISLVVAQSAIWQNWNPIADLGPSNLKDAPVLLTIGPGNYWMFGRYGSAQSRTKRGERQQASARFKPEKATLDGFDIPLLTTPFPNQFDAPGGLKLGLRGYHAWQSRDMKNWVHHDQ